MKNKVNLTSLGIGIICFFLPWVNITCSGEKVTKTGLDLAESNKSLYICLIVLAVLLVLYFVLFQQKKSVQKYKTLYIWGPVVNLCIIGYVYFSVYVNGIETGMGKISYKDLGIEISYGAIIFLLTQIVSLFASINMEEEEYEEQEVFKVKENSNRIIEDVHIVENSAMPKNETISERKNIENNNSIDGEKQKRDKMIEELREKCDNETNEDEKSKLAQQLVSLGYLYYSRFVK